MSRAVLRDIARRAKDLRDVPIRRYLVRTTSRSLNLFVGLCITLWLVQEIFIRTRYPAADYPMLDRGLDILAVLLSSFVTGYIFYIIIDHIPAKRRAYADQLQYEIIIGHILGAYVELHRSVMKRTPRLATLTKGPFAFDRDETKAFWAAAFGSEPTEAGKQILSELEFFCRGVTLSCEQLKNRRLLIDWDLYEAADETVDSFRNYTTADKHRIEIMTMIEFSIPYKMKTFHAYASGRVRSMTYVSGFMRYKSEEIGYQKIWDQIDEDKRKQVPPTKVPQPSTPA